MKVSSQTSIDLIFSLCEGVQVLKINGCQTETLKTIVKQTMHGCIRWFQYSPIPLIVFIVTKSDFVHQWPCMLMRIMAITQNWWEKNGLGNVVSPSVEASMKKNFQSARTNKKKVILEFTYIWYLKAVKWERSVFSQLRTHPYKAKLIYMHINLWVEEDTCIHIP